MAYEIGYDIIVDEDNCDAMSKEYVKRAEKFEGVLAGFCEIIEDILATAVMEGALADNLAKYLEEVEKLKGEVLEIARQAKKCNDGFLTEMNAADSYLF